MAMITLRVLDGADRGRAFENLPTPLTIGREEGNSVQLNDERISRCHLKIQDDDERLVLTDLESTNGTKVNGESVQLWTLRPGDIISVGRTLLLFGSREQIIARLIELRNKDLSEGVQLDASDVEQGTELAWLESEFNLGEDVDARATLHTLLPPDLPRSLTPAQAAQLSELLQYLHLRLRGVVQSVKGNRKSDRMTIDPLQWQSVLDLHDRLARYLRAIGEPAD